MISYQLRQREYLLQISRAMTSRLDLPSLLRLILTSASEMVRAEAGLIALRRGQSTDLIIHASHGIPAGLLPRFAPLLADFPLQTEQYAASPICRRASTWWRVPSCCLCSRWLPCRWFSETGCWG